MIPLAVAAILALAALTVSNIVAVRAFSRPSTNAREVTDWSKIREGISQLISRVDANERGIKDLIVALDEGIKGFKRAENRVQKTVTSARRLVRENGLEHAGIEAEYEELRERDVQPSDSDPVPPVRQEVEVFARSGIPGLSGEELAAITERLNV